MQERILNKNHWCNFQSKTRQRCVVINSIFSKTCFKLFHCRLLEGNQCEKGHANSEKALIRIGKDLLDNLNHTYLLLVKRRKKEKNEFFSIKPFRTYQIFVKETFANKFSFFWLKCVLILSKTKKKRKFLFLFV